MTSHAVTIRFDRIGITPSLRFSCQAGVDAECRTTCNASECEEGCVDPDGHTREPIDFCNVVAWLEGSDDVETYIAGGATEITVPIDYEWSGVYDGPDWRFAETPTQERSHD